MSRLECPICEKKNEIPTDSNEGDRFTCTNCDAQLKLEINKGHKELRCAFCKNDTVECSPDCETRILEREKRGFFDVNLH